MAFVRRCEEDGADPAVGRSVRDPHLSPVEASAEYLRHLAAAFDAGGRARRTGQRLSEQDVLITVPASFDEEARELTLRPPAAGLEHVTLLEEPQAAFYAWLDAHGRQLAAPDRASAI